MDRIGSFLLLLIVFLVLAIVAKKVLKKDSPAGTGQTQADIDKAVAAALAKAGGGSTTAKDSILAPPAWLRSGAASIGNTLLWVAIILVVALGLGYAALKAFGAMAKSKVSMPGLPDIDLPALPGWLTGVDPTTVVIVVAVTFFAIVAARAIASDYKPDTAKKKNPQPFHKAAMYAVLVGGIIGGLAMTGYVASDGDSLWVVVFWALMGLLFVFGIKSWDGSASVTWAILIPLIACFLWLWVPAYYVERGDFSKEPQNKLAKTMAASKKNRQVGNKDYGLDLMVAASNFSEDRWYGKCQKAVEMIRHHAHEDAWDFTGVQGDDWCRTFFEIGYEIYSTEPKLGICQNCRDAEVILELRRFIEVKRPAAVWPRDRWGIMKKYGR